MTSIIIKLLAPFNNKLKLGVNGRKESFRILKNELRTNDRVLWFHCASLGEYEQGLPVFEKLRNTYKEHKIVLTFFSPSGYEIRKNTSIADVVVYLPLDTKTNAKQFLDILHPDYVIFVKYEFWPNYLLEIKQRNIDTILISALFRKDQTFFKWYGKFMRDALSSFKHIFTQNEESKSLIEAIGYNDVTISGDTRFDRVSNQLNIDNSVPFIETFIDNKFCIVLGSTWPDDDKLYVDYINNSNEDQKFIIAPHNIKSSYINILASQLKVNCIKYSEMQNKDLTHYKVFILDTIGYLSKVYSYADIAYIGGAAGNTGLHNILEPAVFGIPLIIGKNYKNFPEAKELIDLGGLTSVSNSNEFISFISELFKNDTLRQTTGKINSNYIEKNKGAVVQIMNYIRI